MKMTIELPDVMFRQAKALAAARGVTLRRFFTEALEVQLLHCEGDSRAGQGGPMAGFGALSDLAHEHRHVLGVIEEEFEKLAPEDRPMILDTNALSAWAEGRAAIEAHLRSAERLEGP